MRRALALMIAATLTAGLAACGDDTVKPGDVVVNWTHGSIATCDTRHVVTIEARAIQKGVTIATEQTSCPSADRSGQVALNDLEPGNYTIEVGAITAAGKETYIGILDRVGVKENDVVETSEIRLGEKPVRLAVDWTVPGGKCAGSGIDSVEIAVVYNATTAESPVFDAAADCNAVYDNPDAPGESLPGVLFEDLEPNGDVVIFVWGLNTTGDRVAEGQKGPPLVLAAGDETKEVVQLETCAGTPPSCD